MQTFHLSNMINTYFLHMFYKCVTNNHLLVGYVSYCGCTSSYKCGLIIWDIWDWFTKDSTWLTTIIEFHAFSGVFFQHSTHDL